MRIRDLLLLAPLCCAPLAAAGGEPSQHEVLHFSANLMFWEYVTFGIIFLVLGVKVIPIMLKQLGTRQASIKDALDKADQVRAEAEVLLKNHEQMMRNAHADAKKITDDAIVAARETAAKITADAEAAGRETRDRAQKELEQMRRKAEAELRDASIELALLAGSSVLARSLTGDDHRRLAKEAIEASTLMKN
ncbi:MAG: ATP synthase F0 subunit B [Planctomycetes bacterium]|nr:ATP synthase F0 subunit B [Planctomycetota bacterium]